MTAGADAYPFEGQFRLARIQVVNWGTLAGHHDVPVPRRGLLITGPSGSGKSTLIDAVSSVLMPANHVRFNAAAQESSSQSGRSLITYVRGAWRREADTDTDTLTSSFLRTGATWSAVGLTYDSGEGKTPTTLVALMHVGRGKTAYADVKRLYLMIDGHADLTGFEQYARRGLETRAIKRAFPEAKVHSSYAPFARAFRRRLGIASEAAQMLLHRTLSAKSLGSLDQLFREYMLDVPRTFATADNAVEQFRNLRAAHRTVVDARRQIEALAPLVALAEQRRGGLDAQASLNEEAEHLDAVHTRLTLSLLREKHESLQAESTLLATAADAARRDAESFRDRIIDLTTRIEGVGGGRLAGLRAQRNSAAATVERVAARRASIDDALRTWGADRPVDGDGFAHLAAQLEAESRAIDAARGERMDRRYEVYSGQARAREERGGLVADRETLARRRSNIDAPLLRARELVCRAAGLEETAVPFAGELIAVRRDEADWSGPIERVLHGLSRTLLVPDDLYPTVAAAVDSEHLGARLVYRRVRTDARYKPAPTPDGSLVRKLETKQGPLTGWLIEHLTHRFDHLCVETAADLRAVRRGVTRAGQVKSDDRHEKDDRRRIDDRSRWALGFDNEAKLVDLRRRIDDLDGTLTDLERTARRLDAEDARLRARQDAARRVLDCSWPEIDVDGARAAVDDLDARIAALTSADSEYATLAAELSGAKARGTEADSARSEAEAALSAHRRSLAEVAERVAEIEGAAAAEIPADVDARIRTRYKAAVRRVTVDNIDRTLVRIQRALDAEVREAQRRAADAAQRITRVLGDYIAQWDEHRSDLRNDPDYVDDALAVLTRLRTEGLPQYEDAFFDMLREQSHRNIGELARLIRKAPGEIRARIEPVNESLGRSPFDTDRTLRIDVKDRRPAAAAEFLSDLGGIAEGSFDIEDREQAETRFAAMAALLERLDSGDPADKRWRRTALDTRLHVGFIGVEVDGAGTDVNFHDSSSGLSGGQAQKLVFFCLAAALRYQLAESGADLPRYATVVLDEAFDRADPAYTRRALDVFAQFGFHLVLATPLKLLQTLEDYIGGVVTVDNPGRDGTVLRMIPFDPEPPGTAAPDTTAPDTTAPGTTTPEPAADADGLAP